MAFPDVKIDTTNTIEKTEIPKVEETAPTTEKTEVVHKDEPVKETEHSVSLNFSFCKECGGIKTWRLAM